MSPDPQKQFYSIREAASLSGLPASTLRYYESRGVLPQARRAESGHRAYTSADIEMITWVGCLAATGMPVARMRDYVTNGAIGPSSAAEQRRLLVLQDEKLAHQQRALELRRSYVRLKIAYWKAVEDGRDQDAERVGAEAATVGESLKHVQSSDQMEEPS